MKNAGKACNNRLYRHIRTFEKIVKNYFVIYMKEITKQVSYELHALQAIKIFFKATPHKYQNPHYIIGAE